MGVSENGAGSRRPRIAAAGQTARLRQAIDDGGISTDLRLARYFGVSEGVFLGMQNDCDLMERRRQIETELQSINPRAA